MAIGEEEKKMEEKYKAISMHSTDRPIDSSIECRWDAEYAFFVLKQCIISRVLLFFIQLITNALCTDYPTDAFKGIQIPKDELSYVDYWLWIIFGGLAKWDAVYFLHIAQFGYTHENTLAFFPLFPILIHYLTRIWSWAMPFIHFSTALMLTAIILNFVAFVLCGQLLYVLLLLLTKSTKIALLGCIVFSFNPASIFFSAVYSESVYMLLTFSALFILYADTTLPFIRHIVAALLFSFAFLTRSNGILNFGYIIFQVIVETFYSTTLQKFIWERECGTVLLKLFRFFAVITICWGIFGSQVVSHGSKMHQFFCKPNASNSNTGVISNAVYQYAMQNKLILPHDLENLTWCRQERSILNPMPRFYEHIQQKYWEVEIFGYWQLKKLPCFLLATPAVFIVLYGSFVELSQLRAIYGSSFAATLGTFQDPRSTIPFMIHAVILTLLALVLYNVEVLTRILFSSSPFIYLVMARYMDRRTPLITLDDVQYPALLPFLTNFSRTHWLHALLLCYLLGYFYIGTLLYANWLPFN